MKTFKENCCSLLNETAKKYSTLLGKDFIIESPYFKSRDKYILRFYKGNFLHLTGVKTKINAAKFFELAIKNELSINDFDCDSTKELKGYTSEKLSHLMLIDSFFDFNLLIQENFTSGKVKCLIAASEGTFTLGFTGGDGALNPMTLLNRNKINPYCAINEYNLTISDRKFDLKIKKT